MGKKEENTHFVCVVCQHPVAPLKNGSYRNHCPRCLSSLHLDDRIPGDRKSTCAGVMKALGLRKSGKKGWQILHVCTKCGALKLNKIAADDPEGDDWMAIVQLSVSSCSDETGY